ncbi:arylamine N-acetyltransferase, partial [Candidatus Albibeggiatoa sp. nov. BB20]|uniref:arylamine N-acetyltransferase family protein n=1 Tax=Candidatus Albibeggiatoa sp. nov. BB20 TaxID=3162723 RepID=UPI00336591CF
IPVVLKDNLSLEIEDIYNKLVVKERGGYCFEHNKLFYELLKNFEFKVTPFLARVVNNQNVQTPKTHRFTVLDYEGGRYLIDVGFGYFSPIVPIKFGGETTFSHVGKSYHIHQYEDQTYSLQIVLKDGFYTLYKFDLSPCFEVDFEMGHFYSHKHKNAIFVNNIVLSTISKDMIKSLRNNDYFKIYKDKEEQIPIDSLEKLKEILNLEFNYPIGEDEIKYIYDNFVV